MNAIGMWEGQFLLWVQEHLRMGGLNEVFRLITTLGNEGIIWIVMILVMLVFKKTRRTAACCALSMILTLLLVNIAIKPLVARIRPYVLLEGLEILVSRPGDFSFPSGHSAHALACAWVIFRRIKNKWGIAALVFAIVMAFSRLYVGVHYPTDVIFGCLAGMGMAEIAMMAVGKFKFRADT